MKTTLKFAVLCLLGLAPLVLLFVACVSGGGSGSSSQRGLTVEEISQGESDITVFPQVGHISQIWSVAFSPNGRHIISSGSDVLGGNVARLWDTNNYRELRTLEGAYRAAFSPDGRYIATCDKSDVKIWNSQNGQLLQIFSGHRDPVDSLAYSNNGKRIVSASEKQIIIWDVERGRKLRTLSANWGRYNMIQSVSFSLDDRYIVSGSAGSNSFGNGFNGRIIVWNAENGRIVRDFKNLNTFNIYSVSFHPNGKYILSGSGDKTVREWDKDS